MKKIIFALCLLLALYAPLASAAASVPEADSAVKVHDFGALLSSEEKSALSDLLAAAREKTGMDFVVLTMKTDPGMSYVDFCDEFFEQGGFGAGADIDGVMLYINTDTRDYYFATYGAAVNLFTDPEMDTLDQLVVPHLSDGRYYDACAAFTQGASETILRATEPGGGVTPDGDGGKPGYPIPAVPNKTPGVPTPADGETSSGFWLFATFRDNEAAFGGVFYVVMFFVVAAGLAVVIALGYGGVSKRPPAARSYLAGKGLRERRREDIFLRTHTTRVRIQSDSNSGGGPRGAGAHRTSGGHSAGGRGGKF